MNATQMINAMEWVEVSPLYEADTRRMVRDERFALLAAVRTRDASQIQAATREAKTVCQMWDVDLRKVRLPET